MNYWATLLCCLISVYTLGQRVVNKFDRNTWKPPYQLIIPYAWTTEHFSLPSDFAPQITYTGVEDIRFTPGWSKRSSQD